MAIDALLGGLGSEGGVPERVVARAARCELGAVDDYFRDGHRIRVQGRGGREKPAEVLLRITSYNVCYTKLLRLVDKKILTKSLFGSKAMFVE